MIRVSFDYDSTLSEERIQDIAETFVKSGHEVHIVTSRCKGANRDLFAVAELLNIPTDRIHFTEGAMKANTLEFLKIDMHYDDMEDEVNLINTTTGCCALLVGFTKCSAAWFLNT